MFSTSDVINQKMISLAYNDILALLTIQE